MMADQRKPTRLHAILWTIAAALAWIATAIRYVNDSPIRWTGVALALLCTVMAVSRWMRLRDAGPATGATPEERR
jgi:hypothetical protein